MYLQVGPLRRVPSAAVADSRACLPFANPSQEFVDHPHIVTLLNVIKARNNQDIYLVFDHMGALATALASSLSVALVSSSLLSYTYPSTPLKKTLSSSQFIFPLSHSKHIHSPSSSL